MQDDELPKMAHRLLLLGIIIVHESDICIRKLIHNELLTMALRPEYAHGRLIQVEQSLALVTANLVNAVIASGSARCPFSKSPMTDAN
jgi:hypothetical protein